MTRTSILILLIVTGASVTPARATMEFGVAGRSGWSDNDWLGDPNGWGIFIAKSVSPRVSLRLAFNRFDNNFRYCGNFLFGFLPPEVDTSTEVIHAEAAVEFLEFTLMHTLVEGDKIRLDLGGGLGFTYFDLDRAGQSTGTSYSLDEDGLMATWMIETTVKKFIRFPFALKVGYQYRKTLTMAGGITDAFVPFDEVVFSDVHAAIVARW